MLHILKDSFLVKKKEFYLSAIVFLYLIISFGVISYYAESIWLPYIQLSLLILENYITVSVYYGIRQSISKGTLDIKGIFLRGRELFLRVLWYKVIAGLFILILVAFCLSMIELVKESSIVTVVFITAFTVLWLSFPVYLFILTVYTPLIIISDETSLFSGIRKSMIFTRNNLADIMKLTGILLPLWGFAIILLKLYNEKSMCQVGIFVFVSLLEIITVKVFLLFYKIREVK